jgi:hypothetical protein
MPASDTLSQRPRSTTSTAINSGATFHDAPQTTNAPLNARIHPPVNLHRCREPQEYTNTPSAPDAHKQQSKQLGAATQPLVDPAAGHHWRAVDAVGLRRLSQRTAISADSAYGGMSAMWSPLQNRPGSYQLAGRVLGIIPMCW